MTFMEAMKLLRKGRLVKRNNWDKGEKLTLMQSPFTPGFYVYLANEDGETLPWCPKLGDFFKEDWIEV